MLGRVKKQIEEKTQEHTKPSTAELLEEHWGEQFLKGRSL